MDNQPSEFDKNQENYPEDDYDAPIVWDSELKFLVVWFALVVVVMSVLLAVMCVKTQSYKILAEHKRKVGRNHKLNPGQRPTKVIGFFHPNW